MGGCAMSAGSCLPILKTALQRGGAIPGRLVGDMLMVDDASSVREHGCRGGCRRRVWGVDCESVDRGGWGWKRDSVRAAGGWMGGDSRGPPTHRPSPVLALGVGM